MSLGRIARGLHLNVPAGAALAALLACCTAVADTEALILTLGPADMTRALTLARWPTSDAERARFHARYTVPVKGPMIDAMFVDRVEVITEFRRLELIGEEHARVNDLFGRAGLQEVEAAISPYRGRLSIVVHVEFQLQSLGLDNVPEIDVLREGMSAIAPFEVQRTDVYGYCPQQRGCDIVGARVEAIFEAVAIDQCSCRVRVRRDLKELAQVVVDFSRMD